MRGNPLLPGNIVLRSGSIPACAGEPRPVDTTPQDESVYPRVCGGTDAQVKSFEPVSGLSPRVRGNQYGNRPRGPNDRSIPACAGEPQRLSASGQRLWVYPRVCGGTEPFFEPPNM